MAVRFAHSTLLITGFTFLGICFSFLSNLVIAARFGVGSDMDAYLSATTLPTLVAAIVAGALGSTFIPVFAEYRERDPAEAWKIASAFLNIAVASGLAIGLIVLPLAPALSRGMTPGLSPEQASQSAELLRWLLPGVVLTIVNELGTGIYYARGRFLAPMLIRVIAPLLTIVYVLAFASSLNVRSLVLATVSASAVQSIILWTGLTREKGFRYSPSFQAGHPAVRRILVLMAPLLLGLSITRLVPAIDRWVASGMPDGSISLLGYANRLMRVIQPLLTAGVSISGFALMARLVARSDRTGLESSMERSFRVLIFFSVPAAVLCCGFATPLVAMVFERGAFSARDTLGTAGLFSVYALSLPVTAVGTVVGQGFYALKDTRTPVVVGVAEIILYGMLCWSLSPLLGLIAIPVSYNLYFMLSVAALSILLSRRAGFSVPRLFLRPLLPAFAASCLALIAGLSLRLAHTGSTLWLLFCLGLAMAVYLSAQKFLFRNREAEQLAGFIREKGAVLFSKRTPS